MSNLAVPYLSLRDLYMKLGLLSAVEPATDEVMANRAMRSYVDDEYDSPHAIPWFHAHHASQFPGDPADACARALSYRMMNVPSSEGPMPSWVTATGVVGKAIEIDLVDAWFKDGRMLAIPEDPADPSVHQLGFVDREHWLTGSTDLPILPKGWRKAHIVECKSKADDVLDGMLLGVVDERGDVTMRQPDKAHVIQLKTTIGLAHEYDWGWVVVCKKCWRITSCEVYERLGLSGGAHPLSDAYNHCWVCKDYDSVSFRLEPPTSGEIYYASRSWPMGNHRLGKRTKTFFYEHDPEFMVAGRRVLAEARDHFVAGTLPPRARHMQWGQGPCQRCRYKPLCRLDEGIQPGKRKATVAPIKTLAESHAVEHAKSIRPNYSLEDTRAAVFAQWGVNGEETA